jgi:DNA-binding PadR family transcriptional regulator
MKNLDDYLPLQEPNLCILLSLHGEEKHGYAIIKDVIKLSSERVKLSTGTLYGALYQLLGQGLIERIELKAGSRGKKAYRLTHSGMKVFEAEVSRMKRMLLAVDDSIRPERGHQVRLGS